MPATKKKKASVSAVSDPMNRTIQPAVIIGTIASPPRVGGVDVIFDANPSGHAVNARCAVAMDDLAPGRQAVLMFEHGDLSRPIVIGLLQEPSADRSPPALPATNSKKHAAHPLDKIVETSADGETVLLTAQREITLRCGHASITLTRAGKVLIRGTYVLSRSTGANRIKGGSVQIN